MSTSARFTGSKNCGRMRRLCSRFNKLAARGTVQGTSAY
jgi:hypothetical protein